MDRPEVRQIPAEVPDVPIDDLEFRSLFEREVSYVWNSLRRLGVREGDLPDQTQEVFVTVHAILDDYDRSRPLRPWLFGIAYRTASHYRRLARNAREVPAGAHGGAALTDSAPLADDQLAHAEDQDLALRALAEVDLPRRSVLVLADIDGVPVPEIARAFDLPLNTAYSRLRLAREDFAAAAKRLRARQRGPR